MFFDEIVGGSPYIFIPRDTGSPPPRNTRINLEELANEHIRNADFRIR